MLFSERSIWTMIHGIGFGGAALLTLAGAITAMYLLQVGDGASAASEASHNGASAAVAKLTGLTALMLWLTSLVGTYIVFPPYRAAPPEGTVVLEDYPRSLLLGDPETAWLHGFAMESKEHLPWIAVMLATAVAFVAWRHRTLLFHNRQIRLIAMSLLALCLAIVGYVSLLGVFVNKVAPLQ